MAIHSKKDENLRRRRESLGHVKLHLDDLERLVEEWERWSSSLTISVGDGVTADFVEDLANATKAEMTQLVVKTENPSVTISLRRHKAEFSYLSTSQDLPIINNFRTSINPYKLRTPYYRLRSFWWVVYLLLSTTTVMAVAKVDNWNAPVWPLFLPYGALVFLLFWFLYSFGRMRGGSSTRIVRGKKVSPGWQKAKALTYWVFPPSALVLGVLLGKYFHKA